MSTANRPGPEATGPLMRCTQCGDTELAEGWLRDHGGHLGSFLQWVHGSMQVGPLGGARNAGRRKATITAFACASCGHLELFAPGRRGR